MLFVTGPTAAFNAAIGWVVILCLTFSLVESKLILPAHLAHMKVKHYEKDTHNAFVRFQRFFSEGLHHFIDDVYAPFLDKALKHRYLTLSVFISLLVLSIGLLAGGIPGFTIAMAIVLTLPFTFGMAPLQGLATMIGVFVGGLSGGLMSGILTGIPGTPSS